MIAKIDFNSMNLTILVVVVINTDNHVENDSHEDEPPFYCY